VGARATWDGSVTMVWDPELKAKVETQHYRHMRSLTASDPHRLVEGGVLMIKISLHGDSFMLHQIRKVDHPVPSHTPTFPGTPCRRSTSPTSPLPVCLHVSLFYCPSSLLDTP
jgi:hypothetical protein